MSLKQVGKMTPLGGFFASPGYAGIVEVHGEVALNLGSMSKARTSAVVMSLKRGYSRGNSESEQYSLYAAVSEKFGLKHSKVSNSRYNWLAVPDGVEWRTFRLRMVDVLEPMFRLTEEEFSRKDALSESSWGSWNPIRIRGQAAIKFQRPQKVPMGVLGPGLAKLIGEPPFGPLCEAIDFVKKGGKITYTF